MPDLIRAENDADFIALVPALAGMRLERSLALVPFAGTRTLGAARFDLPDRRDTRSMRSLADRCVATAARMPGADGVAVVVYTDATFAAEHGIPWHDLVRAVETRMRRAGFRIVSLLCAAGDGWGRYDRRGDRGPWPLADVDGSRVHGLARALLDDLETPTAWAQLPAPEPELHAEIDATIEVIVDEWERVEAMGARHGDLVLPDTARGVHVIVERALEVAVRHGAGAVRPGDLALLTAYAAVPSWRDTLMLQLAFGLELGERAAEQQRAWHRRRAASGASMDEVVAQALAAGDGPDDGVDGLITGQGTRRPDLARCRAGIGMLLRAAANIDPPSRPGLLCMAGWLAWATGRSTAAHLLLAEALAIDPGHGMSRLVVTLVDAGAVPEWAFDGDGLPDPFEEAVAALTRK